MRETLEEGREMEEEREMEERIVGGQLQDQVTLSSNLPLHGTSVAKAEATHPLVRTNTHLYPMST